MGGMAENALPPSSSLGSRLRPNALKILEKRYLLRSDETGQVIETPDQLMTRVARAVACVEADGTLRRFWEERFHELLCSLRFLPNSPTLMNAGKSGGQLSACFVLPIDDSLDSIFSALGHAAKIHQSGGGTGFAFSRIRSAGSQVASSSGVASGPVSFLKIFDLATETIKQGGTRRGANMAVMRVDHPDIFEFIRVKQDLRSVTNFNLSVGLTHSFMQSLFSGGALELADLSVASEHKRVVAAADVFGAIAQGAWTSGDPGILFLDQINRFNPTPLIGCFESTNPCGEQPLLPYESCNLGSLNLGLYLIEEGSGGALCFDWQLFERDIATAVRFLDNVIDANVYPVAACAQITRTNRKIGLGVMGFADLLLGLRVPYSSLEASLWAERVMSFVDRTAKRASANLAQEKGSFVGFGGSMWSQLGYPELRNATVTTVAPTGTISLIAGCSSGIEPYFSAYTVRNALDGEVLREWAPGVEREMNRRGVFDLNEEVVNLELKGVLEDAHVLDSAAHLRIQRSFQRHCDSAVSKTVNLPESATLRQVQEVFVQAYRHGCKGVTVYRDQCRPTQVLEKKGDSGSRADLFDTEASSCPKCEWAE